MICRSIDQLHTNRRKDRKDGQLGWVRRVGAEQQKKKRGFRVGFNCFGAVSLPDCFKLCFVVLVEATAAAVAAAAAAVAGERLEPFILAPLATTPAPGSSCCLGPALAARVESAAVTTGWDGDVFGGRRSDDLAGLLPKLKWKPALMPLLMLRLCLCLWL